MHSKMYSIFFRHDVSTSHVDAVTKFIMESCIAENDADQHASNIQVSASHVKVTKLNHFREVAVVEWLSSWLVEQKVGGSNPGLTTSISEIGYQLLPSCDDSKIVKAK